jgi:uncharacterized protein YyaL (SSP411 family)
MPIVREEGKYYVWTARTYCDIRTRGNLFSDYYNSTKNGNWEDKKRIFCLENLLMAIATKYKISLETLDRKLKKVALNC